MEERERNEKILGLLNDETFMNGLDTIDSVEGLQAAFAANGVELTLEETKDVINAVGIHSEEYELSEDVLEDVAGGVSVKSLLGAMVKAFKKGWEYGKKFYEWERRVLG